MDSLMIMTRANYPNPQAYVLRWLVAKYLAENNPTLQIDLFGWFPEPAHDAYPKFLKALHARINTRGDVNQPHMGRKYSREYQNAQMGDCLDIRRNLTQRMLIHERQLRTPEMRRRYDHLVTHHWEL